MQCSNLELILQISLNLFFLDFVSKTCSTPRITRRPLVSAGEICNWQASMRLSQTHRPTCKWSRRRVALPAHRRFESRLYAPEISSQALCFFILFYFSPAGITTVNVTSWHLDSARRFAAFSASKSIHVCGWTLSSLGEESVSSLKRWNPLISFHVVQCITLIIHHG